MPPVLSLPGASQKRVSVSEYVRQVLREAILTLKLPPGSVIDKASLCKQLNVSKFPVTDALSHLHAEGLVEVRARSGTVVSLIKVNEVRQAAFIRGSLEIETVRKLALTATPNLVQRLETNLNYQRSAISHGDRLGFHEFDLEFHAIILEELGYPVVDQVLETCRGRLDRARRILAPERKQNLILLEHTQIKVALATKRPAGAAEAMRRHLDAGFSLLMEFMSKNPSKFDGG
jgi:DNA-binding GntR family transcriptional regulator